MNKPTDYKHIKAWGEMLKSYKYYIDNQQEQAAHDNAPINAIYRGNDDQWKTVDDIADEQKRAYINAQAA